MDEFDDVTEGPEPFRCRYLVSGPAFEQTLVNPLRKNICTEACFVSVCVLLYVSSSTSSSGSVHSFLLFLPFASQSF